jgi:hypothetical protein
MYKKQNFRNSDFKQVFYGAYAMTFVELLVSMKNNDDDDIVLNCDMNTTLFQVVALYEVEHRAQG